MVDYNTENLKEYLFTIGDVKFNFFTDVGMLIEGRNTSNAVHTHEYNELFYVLKGSVTIRTEKNSFCINEGDAVLVPAGTLHTTINFENTQRIAISYFTEKNKKEKLYTQFSQFESILLNGIVHITNFSGGHAFKRLTHYYYSSYHDKDELICSCLREIIILIKVATKTEGRISSPPVVFDTSAYRNYVIDNYFSSHFKTATLTELSKKLHLSKQQTERIVKKLYGCNFREYLGFIRMRHARELLLNTNMSSTEISTEIGYCYPHSFLTAFKKHYGKTPGSYRKENC